jgi:hypothetical protein
MSRARRRADWLHRHRSAPAGATPAPAIPGVAAVHLHIGEISLQGLPRLSRHDLADAVSAELTSLIAGAGLPPPLRAAGRTERLAGQTITVARGGQAATVGRQVAGAIFGGGGR